MQWPDDFDARVRGNFDGQEPDLRVREIQWSDYPGATEEEMVVYAIESMALRRLPDDIKQKLERIIIDREPING